MKEDKLQYCTKHHTSYVTECHSCYREKTMCIHGVQFDSECGECEEDKDDYRHITDSPFAIDASKIVIKERPNVPHYQSGGIEPIEYINSHNFNFNIGNCVKYVTRAGKKGDAITDLKKAIDYLNFEIERLKNENTSA